MMTIITYGQWLIWHGKLVQVWSHALENRNFLKTTFMDALAYTKQVPRSSLQGLRMKGRIKLVQNDKSRSLYDSG
jgi:hypothetical protein